MRGGPGTTAVHPRHRRAARSPDDTPPPHPARPVPPEEPTLSREPLSAAPQTLAPAPAAVARARAPRPGDRLAPFNAAPAATAEASLLTCCGSRRWARRVAAHRPYPDVDALLAAADEAAYDLSGADLDEALCAEEPPVLLPGSCPAAVTALRAAHDAYLTRFGHPFVVCLDADRPEEHPGWLVSGIRSRLGNEPEKERAVAAEELRRLIRARLVRILT
ncbi:2-oxo-4-hydroxy-4-carboxy-5-ureidoimidazoline decarboxylase [Streptomyces somaliensis]|uniref:2-oxo-4-hydroxy-4-carboxy-5-ureidoimidazoline decarboxylase n=1 Tax=Streptomyces somaliensis TaxID=78355 RepID=UPI0020CFBBA1|nr:2-oxo-4-hydroxy-4-carboxy-5-ureidoimidazoline decarboxylase [Streptomyces somaliensis]MCP9944866.1 2-oxo-4-hydroxy-4-carboxy-5-ureidoimidazoline decarboxylase [Streptomyces somaliensis]MCP9961907.1 2-oxo-4-hydroxy-4-carboxy-5-ureidoimidazoline decarboxylase [Streptomyces somaliensis]MCP9974729.1 2-oxo-4-hydroxy-4-carboxy-5-ureidoimidazoline decarboxylase [Streptomyces somaliensis]